MAGTTTTSLITEAQYRADRVNASSITTAEWTSYVLRSAQELYGALCNTYEDYNVKIYPFSLAGGDPPGNALQVGYGSAVGDFYLLRGVMYQVAPGPGVRWVALERLEGLKERQRFLGPSNSVYWGSYPSRYHMYGNTIETLPPQSAAGNYQLWYVPSFPAVLQANDTIDQYFMTVNGWDEFVVLGAAAKALIKEESIETANVVLQQQQGVKQRIMMEAAPRDDGSPGRITDSRSNTEAMGYPYGGDYFGRFW